MGAWRQWLLGGRRNFCQRKNQELTMNQEFPYSDPPSHGRRYHQLRPPGGPVRRFRVSLQFFNNNLFVAATTPRLSLTWPPILLNITRLRDGLKRPSLPYRSMKLVRMPAGSGVSQPTPSNTSPAGTLDLEKRKSQTEERWIFPHATKF